MSSTESDRYASWKRRWGDRDRTFENQRYRASGLDLVVRAIILWNTVYLDRAIKALRAHGVPVDGALLRHLSPIGWSHMALTGDYTWQSHRGFARGRFRPLRLIGAPPGGSDA